MLFLFKNFVYRFYVKNFFLLQEMVGGGEGAGTRPCSPFLYSPVFLILIAYTMIRSSQ